MRFLFCHDISWFLIWQIGKSFELQRICHSTENMSKVLFPRPDNGSISTDRMFERELCGHHFALHNTYRPRQRLFTYMPYLTLWDKISQNLAYLEASSYKIFNSHPHEFSNQLMTHLWRNKTHLALFVVFIRSFLYFNKGSWLFGGCSLILVKILGVAGYTEENLALSNLP